jgi:hypothetical protein
MVLAEHAHTVIDEFSGQRGGRVELVATCDGIIGVTVALA